MSTLFAMAGFAEAAIVLTLLVILGGLVLLALTAFIGWYWRSRVAAVIAFWGGFLIGLLIMPWEAFRVIQSDDPDVYDLVLFHRIVSFVWAIGFAGAIASLVRAYKDRPTKVLQRNHSPP
jgi:hypothetical protein